jgi:hypothetical protein
VKTTIDLSDTYSYSYSGKLELISGKNGKTYDGLTLVSSYVELEDFISLIEWELPPLIEPNILVYNSECERIVRIAERAIDDYIKLRKFLDRLGIEFKEEEKEGKDDSA